MDRKVGFESKRHVRSLMKYLNTHAVIAEVCPAQLRLIFQPQIDRARHSRAPYLVYAHRFDRVVDNPGFTASRLPRLQRAHRQFEGRRVCNGSVLSLSRILTAVDIQPSFGQDADDRLTVDNSLEISKQHVLNIYSDKSIHYMFT